MYVQRKMILKYKCHQINSMTEKAHNGERLNLFLFFRYLVLLQQVLVDLRPALLYCDSRDCQIYLMTGSRKGFLSLQEGITWKLMKPSAFSSVLITQALRKTLRANRSLLPGRIPTYRTDSGCLPRRDCSFCWTRANRGRTTER